MHERVRAALMSFFGINSPSRAIYSNHQSFRSSTARPKYSSVLNHAIAPSRVAVSALLQLAWPVCSAYWTTSSPLSQFCTAHHTTSPKPCSSKLVLRAPRPLAWFLAPPLSARSRFCSSISTKRRTKYEVP